VHPSDELRPADLLDANATSRAVAGSSVAYLVAGLKYDTDVWRTEWPLVMRNAMDACKRHGAPLVFFDNVYAYGRVNGAMTEDTPYNPCSRKGEVRARIAETFMDDVRRGNLRGMIVRAADFYGPGAVLSLTHATVFERLRARRAPQWIGNPRAVHTFTYTPDAGRTLALLGNTESAYGQVWHAATSRDEMEGYGDALSVRIRLSLRQQQARTRVRAGGDLVCRRHRCCARVVDTVASWSVELHVGRAQGTDDASV
jgi:nucleoside-diphosphate-sugar epimerase